MDVCHQELVQWQDIYQWHSVRYFVLSSIETSALSCLSVSISYLFFLHSFPIFGHTLSILYYIFFHLSGCILPFVYLSCFHISTRVLWLSFDDSDNFICLMCSIFLPAVLSDSPLCLQVTDFVYPNGYPCPCPSWLHLCPSPWQSLYLSLSHIIYSIIHNCGWHVFFSHVSLLQWACVFVFCECWWFHFTHFFCIYHVHHLFLFILKRFHPLLIISLLIPPFHDTIVFPWFPTFSSVSFYSRPFTTQVNISSNALVLFSLSVVHHTLFHISFMWTSYHLCLIGTLCTVADKVVV